MDIHASGYLLKPVTAEKVRRELEDLRYPVPMETGMRVRFQCFGNFEAFLDNKPVVFQHEKTREILAYLVDRRAVCGNDEIIAALWQGKISGSYFRALRKDLVDTFQSRGCGDIFIQRWARIGIDGERVSCDYYDWQKGRPDAINAYRGEYMSQYDWAVLRVQPFEPR